MLKCFFVFCFIYTGVNLETEVLLQQIIRLFQKLKGEIVSYFNYIFTQKETYIFMLKLLFFLFTFLGVSFGNYTITVLLQEFNSYNQLSNGTACANGKDKCKLYFKICLDPITTNYTDTLIGTCNSAPGYSKICSTKSGGYFSGDNVKFFNYTLYDQWVNPQPKHVFMPWQGALLKLEAYRYEDHALIDEFALQIKPIGLSPADIDVQANNQYKNFCHSHTRGNAHHRTPHNVTNTLFRFGIKVACYPAPTTNTTSATNTPATSVPVTTTTISPTSITTTASTTTTRATTTTPTTSSTSPITTTSTITPSTTTATSTTITPSTTTTTPTTTTPTSTTPTTTTSTATPFNTSITPTTTTSTTTTPITTPSTTTATSTTITPSTTTTTPTTTTPTTTTPTTTTSTATPFNTSTTLTTTTSTTTTPITTPSTTTATSTITTSATTTPTVPTPTTLVLTTTAVVPTTGIQTTTITPPPTFTTPTTTVLTTTTVVQTTGVQTTIIITPIIHVPTTTTLASPTTTPVNGTSYGIISTTTTSPSQTLSNIANKNLTTESVGGALSDVQRIVNAPNEHETLSAKDVDNVAQILSKASNLSLEPLEFQNFMNSINGLHELEEQLLVVSSANILTALNNMIKHLTSQTSTFSSKYVAIQTESTNCSSHTAEPLLGIKLQKDGQIDSIKSSAAADGKNIESSAEFSRRQVCQGVRVAFTVFRSLKLFAKYETNEADTGNITCTNISLACSYPTIKSLGRGYTLITALLLDHDHNFMNKLQQPIQLTFSKSDKYKDYLHASYLGGFWERDTKRWSSEGCFIEKQDVETYTFNCNHLTDFTLLIESTVSDIDPTLCSKPLLIVGSTCCAVSVTTLTFVILLLAYELYADRNSAMNQVLESQQSKALRVYFLMTLELFYVVYLLFSDQNVLNISRFGCSIVAMLLYILLLSSIMQTFLKSMRYFQRAYLVHRHNLNDLLNNSTITAVMTFGVPLLVGVYMYGFPPKEANPFMRGDCFCWIRPNLVAYAIIVPIILLFLNAFVLWLVLIWNFFYKTRHYNRETEILSDRRRKLRLLLLILIQMTLGLPWVIQFFTLHKPKIDATHWLFSIWNALQGCFIGLFSLYEREDPFATIRRSLQRRKRLSQNSRLFTGTFDSSDS